MSINMPTILVKRSDGTSVRMSLDEFKKMKMSNSTQILGSSPTPEPPKAEKAQEASKPEPVRDEIKEKADEIRRKIREDIKKMEAEDMTAEAKKSVQTAPKGNAWGSDDHKSLLDDEFHKEMPVLVREGEHILARTAPVKDVFMNEAEYEAKKNEPKPGMRIEKPRSVFDNRSKFDRNATAKNIRLMEEPSILQNKKPPAPRSIMPSPRPLAPKPVIQDVKPPKVEKQTMGPVDELLKFTLDDFRRLGRNTEESAVKLREKFKYLESDSFLMFMDGVEAWYNSPLYRQYQEVISKSLMNRMSVADILSGVSAKTDLKLEEFKAILKLNQSFY